MTTKITPHLRRATADDAPLLAELGARTFYDSYAAQTDPDDMAQFLASVFGPDKQAAELADPLATFLIAEWEGQAIGYAKLHAGEAPDAIMGPAPICLGNLYVVEPWIGHGVGAALMRACLDEARRTGYRTLWLSVWERNARAQRFYQQWGFRIVGEQSFHMSTEQQTDLLMERPVEP